LKQTLAPLDALNRVPGIDPGAASISALGGGLTNRVYLVISGERKLVLRLASDGNEMVAPVRSCEVEIMQVAAAAGIAPPVIYADSARGILVTEYLDGAVWQTADLENARNIERLAQLLRRVHALPLCGTRLNLPVMAGRYARFLQAAEHATQFAEHCVQIVRALATVDQLACCHNDVVASNVIDANGLKLIDWEYAGDNDPYFDLASVIAYHDLDEDLQRVLLHAYAGSSDALLSSRLAGQIRVFDAIQWLWLACRQVTAPRAAQAMRLAEIEQRIG
jgi:thiamine kinase